MALTERQQQIKDLLTQGKKAEEIGKALGITTNAVYQQIRRMRKGGANVSTPTGGGARKSGRKSGGKGPKLETPPKPAAPAAAPAHVTPLQAVRARRDEIRAATRECEASVAAAERALDAAKAQAEKVAARHKDELKALDKAEAVLRPQQPAAPAAKKPAAKKGGNAAASRSRTTTKGSGGTAASTASPNGSSSAQDGAEGAGTPEEAPVTA